jgi:hypothetical protein
MSRSALFRIVGPLVLVFGVGAGLASGCATSGSSPAPAPAPSSSAGAAPGAASSGPVVLTGSRWKLPTLDDSFDGTIIEFSLSPDGRYLGKLVEAGKTIRSRAGATVGLVMVELWPSQGNAYNGLFRRPGRPPLDVTFSVSADGRELKASEGNVYWVRVQ